MLLARARVETAFGMLSSGGSFMCSRVLVAVAFYFQFSIGQACYQETESCEV